ncbi:hypothetical protein [Alcanivorax jadensis]|uniref:hypothetical protein n=1 Tax=Alcanivorax jadensis TaxID=64988 RepID=UPI0026F103B5|nr:hypothetical protein [Alcanivorax jadensis]
MASIPATLSEKEMTGGMATAILGESGARPTASASSIKNIVEVYDDTTDGYEGHRWEEIQTIYPSILCFKANDLDFQESDKAFYILSICHLIATESWIDEEISAQLIALCELDLKEIPYKTLCRSIFDTDRSSLFLSLYRCIEAIYAYDGANKISTALNLNIKWTDIAIALEDKLNWRPHEENSLSGLLKNSNNHTATKIVTALNITEPPENITSFAAKKVYKLRNGLVHYRPSHQSLDFDEIDWAMLCSGMIDIVFDIYYQVFGSAIEK